MTFPTLGPRERQDPVFKGFHGIQRFFGAINSAVPSSLAKISLDFPCILRSDFRSKSFRALPPHTPCCPVSLPPLLRRMNLSDLLYPGNPKRRQEVTDLHRKLLDCLQLDFKATNELIDTLNAHLGAGLPHIAMKGEGTIKENCDIIIHVLQEIQREVRKSDRDMKGKLEPGMYLRLYDLKQPELGKIAVAHSIVSTILGEATATAGTVAVKLMCSNLVTVTVSKLLALLAQIGVSVLGGIGIGILGLGLDIILHAILGAVERETLLAAIQSYEQHLAAFEEASEAYQAAVAELSASLKDKAEFGGAPPHQ
ncbi:hypothetical protein lerEdw1_003822 [Lerista edwardsae]|nr:hypothetical protein lerEdw1_003822 [Lerista edwardsae]